VLVGNGLDLAIGAADYRRDRVRLDHEILGEPLNLFLRLESGGGVGISDRNEVCHLPSILSARLRFAVTER
jgi:hypothetical protein